MTSPLPHDALFRDASARGIACLQSLPERPVFPSASTLQRLAELDFDLPEQPTDPAEVLARLHAPAARR
jgi:hypothetical protein